MVKSPGPAAIATPDAADLRETGAPFSRSAFGFATLSADGRILYANAAFRRALHLQAGSDLPLLEDIVSPKDHAALEQVLGDRQAEQAPWEIRFRRADRSEFWVLASFTSAGKADADRGVARLLQTVDIDERKRNTLELCEREARWNQALESAGQGVWDHDFARNSLFYSRQWRSIRGIDADEQPDFSLSNWIGNVHPDDRAHVIAEINRQESGETPFNVFAYREKHRDGHWIWIESRGAVVEYGDDGKPSRTAGTDTDITDRKEAEERLAQLSHRLALAFQVSNFGVFNVNLRTGEVKWDDRIMEIYGMTETPDATSWEAALHPEDRRKAVTKVERGLASRRDFPNAFRIIRGDGEIRHIRGRSTHYIDLAGIPHLIGANWDVTEDVRVQEELKHARDLAEARNVELEAARDRIEYTALHDHLTGLPNRRYLDRVIGAAAGEARHTGERLAVLHIDLDRFKEINDTLGHLAGDRMLNHAAAVLTLLKGPDDFVARIGGDEFVFLARGAAKRNLSALADRIVTEMRKPVPFEGHVCRFGASVGIASQAGEAIDPRQLLLNADLALYRAKNRGRGRHEFFTNDIQAQIIVTKQTADDILAGIEQRRFLPYYQPQFCARTLDIVSLETLARWNHPTRGILGPDAFLKIAEDLDCMATIDGIVLEKALDDFARWEERGLGIHRISTNVSAKRLHDPELRHTLRRLPIRPQTLSFELLESIFLDDCDRTVLENLAEIRRLGIDIEIDDFGTGHASIISLLKLGPRRLKIDRQLVKPVNRSPGQRKLVGTIIEIGRSLDIEVIAEGVETSAHVAILRDLGCNILQGFALARPLPAEAIADFVLGQQWREAAAVYPFQPDLRRTHARL